MAHKNIELQCAAKQPDPPDLSNAPGKPTIDYRIGMHPEFLERMKYRIPRTTVTDSLTGAISVPLRTLRARETSDPTIALMDAFAASLDVTAFYSERIANEAYIGTAIQRRSVLELARLIGYELAPGVAASTHLAFTVEGADDPFRAVEVPVGVQAMSIPQKKGDLPQIFETVDTITARAEWNAIGIRQLQEQNLAIFQGDENDDHNGNLYLFDLDNSFAEDLDDPELEIIEQENLLASYFPLDGVLDLENRLSEIKDDYLINPEIEPVLKALPVDEIFLGGTGLGLQPGQRLLLVGHKPDNETEKEVKTATYRILLVDEDPNYRITRLRFSKHGKLPERTRTRPVFRLPKLPIRSLPRTSYNLTTNRADSLIVNGVWSGSAMNALVSSQGWKRSSVMSLVKQSLSRRVNRPVVNESTTGKPGLYVMRAEGGFFGQGAARQEALALSDETKGGTAADPYKKSWDAPVRTIWVDSQGVLLGGTAHAYLDREYKELLPESWAIFENPTDDGNTSNSAFQITSVGHVARSDFATNGKTTGVKLADASGIAVAPVVETTPSSLNAFKFRTARFYGQSQQLEIAGIPIYEDITYETVHLDLDGLFLDLRSGQAISLSGNRTDAEGLSDSETLAVSDIVHIGGYTRLLLQYSPANSYQRTSVKINANVSPATHGEYFEEIIGSGGATVPNQIFRLGKKPLTYTSASNELGRQTSLQVRVNGILWDEVPTLWNTGPDDAVYQVRMDDDGNVRVQFGDGVNGRRLASGEGNVTAGYRTGSGLAGEVADEAIALLKTKPLGIKSAVNPSAASGSAEPELLDTARTNAPQSMRSFGRIVSLSDYEDFARGFAGVGKAKAISLWSPGGQTAHLTISPENDAILEESAPLLANIRAAIDKLRDPNRPFVVQSYQRLYFQIQAKIRTNSAYIPEQVEQAVREQLANDFGYSARSIGQPVSAADVVASLHGVEGIESADLDILDLIEDGETAVTPTAKLDSVILAATANVTDSDGSLAFTASELLTVLPSSIHLILETSRA